MNKNIGFVSFRFAGTDGVSLETKKWADIFERNNCTCFYMGGELDTPPEHSMFAPYLHFQEPEVRSTYEQCFSRGARPPELTRTLHEHREKIKASLYEFVEKFSIDILVPENAVTIPLNVPLGMALTEFIAETGINTIAHHHDFFWERKRFLVNCVWDYLNSCYPPHLGHIHHVVINTSGQNQLALRTGISSTLIPNVMDFETPAPGIDDYNRDVREVLGVAEDELFILQPTRVVQRKGIEHAIELVARLERKAALVISHASGDEGYEYQTRVHEYADMLGIRAIFVDDIIADSRGTTADGRKIYNLQDVYPHADLITYPSIFEGFGNAFLETVYFRKPIMVNNYSIYSHDIKPLGFQVIEMDDFVAKDTVRRTKEVLDNPDLAREMVDRNYELALQYFSYSVLEKKLWYIARSFYGIEDLHLK
ncbi:MAG: glycosyltransferase family 4 protein [Spirochaeta sp.]|jgi:glycosyltransferase involved in cell wall biosynthesis|nr:glycosyltransferase family 4 protein [Spirochaeta sp.]